MSGTVIQWKALIARGRFEVFEARDGARIRYAAWEPEGPVRGTVVFLNGRAEFIEKYVETIGELLDRGFAVWAKDWRGQGLSARLCPRKGHARSFDPLLCDLHQFLIEIVRPNSAGPYLALAHSMGGHLVLRYLAEHPGFFSRAVLSAPMVGIQTLGFPNLLVEGLAHLAVRFGFGDRYVPGMGDADPYQTAFAENVLTSDPDRFRQTQILTEENPALGLGGPTYGWMRAAFKSMRKTADPDYVRAIDVPVLFLSAGEERVVQNAAQERLSRRLAQGRFVSLAASRHEILLEQDFVRARFWENFDRFTKPV
ncbi:MAG: alpha/beta hydrolase [Rhodospirillaceae bacterium]|nr:MAG: alpha/beta hydrolase [Rhodospirillaceae bacterium]